VKPANLLFDAHRRLRNGWWIVVFFVVLALMLLPLLLMGGGPQAVAMPAQAGLVFVASALCQLLRRRPFAELSGRFDGRWLWQCIAGIAFGAALMLVPAMLLHAAGFVRWDHGQMGVAAFGDALLSCAAVAVAEELLFRGFVFQRVIDGLGLWPAQWLMAGYFLLNHAGAVDAAGGVKYMACANIFIAAMVFGLAFVRTTSLAMPIGMHFAANLVQGAVLGFGVSGNEGVGLFKPESSTAPQWLTGGAFGLEASLPGLLSIITILVLLYRWQPVKSARGSSSR
jgi:uncharacterized protein